MNLATGEADTAASSRSLWSLVDRRLLRTALIAWLGVRALVAAVWLVLTIADRREPVERLPRGLLAWDGDWYDLIARVGYQPDGEEIRFFPLYPWLGRAAGLVAGDRPGIGLVVVANLAALAAAVLLGAFALRVGRDWSTARAAVWAMSFWPAAFVFVFAYSEALFVTLTLVCALAARDRRWMIAAMAAFLAGLTRPTALALAVLLVAAAADEWRDVPATRRALRAGACLSPFAGVGAFALLSRRWHGALDGPFSTQEPLRGDLVDPFSRIGQGVLDAVGPERFGDGLHLPFALLAVAAIALVWREVGRAEALYTAAFVVVAISAENWNSLERYTLNAFPVFVAFGALASRRRRLVQIGALAVSAAGLVGLTTLAWTGHYVP